MSYKTGRCYTASLGSRKVGSIHNSKVSTEPSRYYVSIKYLGIVPTRFSGKSDSKEIYSEIKEIFNLLKSKDVISWCIIKINIYSPTKIFMTIFTASWKNPSASEARILSSQRAFIFALSAVVKALLRWYQTNLCNPKDYCKFNLIFLIWLNF